MTKSKYLYILKIERIDKKGEKMKKNTTLKEQSTLLPEDVVQNLDNLINLLEYLKRKVNAKRYVVFNKYVSMYKVNGDLVGPFYPGELVMVPTKVADDLYAKGLVEKPKQTRHTYFIELIDKDEHYVLSVYSPKKINRELRVIYKEYAIRHKKEDIKNDISTEFFVDFLRKYKLFREICMSYYSAQKNMPFSVVFSKSRQVGVPKGYVSTLLSILEDKGYVVKNKSSIKLVKPLENLPEDDF